MKLPSKGDFAREAIARGGLHEFLRRFWCIADPKCPLFIDNWHFGAKAEMLTAVSQRQIRNLVINEPPGLGKSLTVDVLWPAWHWGAFGDPRHAWMSISFDHSLVLRNAGQLIQVVTSPLYRAAYPDFKFGGTKSAIGEFFNAHGGYRFSTSFDGKGTGRHVHTQVCDDPVKPKDWNNDRALAEVLAKWNGTFSSRAIDRQTFARVVIMQRIAERDIAGAMLDEHGYEHLCLPMRYVPNAVWDRGNSVGVTDRRVNDGELLFPERLPAEEVDRAELDLGSPGVVAAQYQQNPTPEIGGIVEAEWLSAEWNSLPKDIQLFQSWDFGFKGRQDLEEAKQSIREGRSRVHGALFGLSPSLEKAFFVDEMPPAKLNFPESRRALLEHNQRTLWSKSVAILVEDKANGPGIIDDLKDMLREAQREGRQANALTKLCARIIAINPEDQDKIARIVKHTFFLMNGGLLVPSVEACPTIHAWRAEIVGFPKGRYNDRVDTASQALDFARSPIEKYRRALRKLRP